MVSRCAPSETGGWAEGAELEEAGSLRWWLMVGFLSR